MENERDAVVNEAPKKRKKSLGRQCAAYGCYSTFYKTDGLPSGLHFFRFPQKNQEKNRWCNLIKRVDGRDDFNVTSCTCLCEKHFTDSDIKKLPNMWRLNKGACPSLNLYTRENIKPRPSRKSPKERSSLTTSASTSVVDAKGPGKLTSALLSVVDVEDFGSLLSPSDIDNACISTQTTFSFVHSPLYYSSEDDQQVQSKYLQDIPEKNDLIEFCTQYESLSLKAKELSSSVESLKQQIIYLENQIKFLKKTLFSFEKIAQDDSAVKFYTGFPNSKSLLAVFEYFQPKLGHLHYWRGPKSVNSTNLPYQQTTEADKPGHNRILSHLEEFVFVLMRLKLGLFLNDLADRFGISQGHASKIFTTWINFLFHELPPLFPFPSQERIRKDMPDQFKDYPTTRIIIDGTEIFTEVPSSLKSQSQTWSEYKHHNTWKALVGISPTGCIIFVSKLWAGRVSDKELTQRSGILNFLQDGDNVMADRGFDIADILPHGVSLNIPPFKGNRKQLSAPEVEETARIASVRIHVERAIGRVKNYHILDGTMSLSLQPVLNQIFSVCCLLTNFQPYLVQPSSKK